MAKYDVIILTAFFEIGPFQKGMGYRFWEFAQTLADCGMSVALITPAPSRFSHPRVEILTKHSLGSNKISDLSDVFVFCLHEDEALISGLYKKNKLLIYDSVLTPIEGLNFQKTLDMKDKKNKKDFFQALVEKHKLFNRVSSLYLTGTKEEKLLKIGELLAGNQIDPENYNTIAKRVAVLPVCGFNRHSIPVKLTTKVGNLVLWNGGLWNHYNYTPLINSVVELKKSGCDIKLRFLYKNSTQVYSQIHSRIENEGLKNIIEIPELGEGNPDFFEKQSIISKARALVLFNEHTLLSEMVLPMRIREALLFEKPMIVSDFGMLGDFVRKQKIGIVVQNSEDHIGRALKTMFKDKKAYSSFKGNIRKIKSHFYYEKFVPEIVKSIRGLSENSQ